VVLGGTSEHLGGEILQLDRFRDAARFVETIHIEVVEQVVEEEEK
jgi:hypothetical protein